MRRKTDSNNPADWLYIAAKDLEDLHASAEQELGYAMGRSKLAGRDAGPPSSVTGETTRVSCAVSLDLHNRDGALKLYYPDGVSELLLFKFCGQP